MQKDERSPDEKAADLRASAARKMDMAHRARTVLDDEYFATKCEQIRQDIWKMFATSQLEDDMARTVARHRLEGLNDILRLLKHDVEDEKLARLDLHELELKEQKRAR